MNRTLIIPVVIVLIVAAQSERSVESLLHAGDVAVSESRWDDAEKLYAEAMEKSRDPGLVSFNRATALAKAKRYDEAERHYYQALEDGEAPITRRANALYNRGVCLIYKSGIQNLRTAIDSFERAIRTDALDVPTRSDAVLNLELAKILWLEASSKVTEKPLPSDPPRDTPPDPKETKREKSNDSTGDPNGNNNPQTTKIDPITGQPRVDSPKVTTNKTIGGRGTLPVVIDDSWRPNTQEDANAYLDRLAERLKKERKVARDTLAPAERPNVKNW